MPYRQKYNPNVGIRAARGWCLKYIDDAGKAPNRTPNAATALRNERNAKRMKTSTPPKNIWVVGFLDLRAGRWAGDDHVFFMKYKGNGKYEIRDSESNGGGRGVYGSIAELLRWFGNYSPVYVGWSTHCDGRQYVEWYTAPKKKSAQAVATDIANGKGGWGNMPARKKNLEKAGYNYNDVQSRVNKILADKKKPAKKYHTVKRGDTMSAIALTYGTTLAKLAKLNPSIKNLNLISVGQKVRVK